MELKRKKKPMTDSEKLSIALDIMTDDQVDEYAEATGENK